MHLEDVIKRRRTVRAFKQDKVEESKVNAILNAACAGPSAGNLQSYRIFLVDNRDTLKKLASTAFDQEFISQAPLCLVFCADPEKSASEYGQRGRELYSVQDATISAVFATLKAVEEGLSTAWVGAFDEAEVSDIIGSGNLRPIAIIPIGKPNKKPREIKRRGLRDQVQEFG